MIPVGDFRNGITPEIDGQAVQTTKFQHVKSGRGAAFVRIKLKNVINGGVVKHTLRPTEKFPQARIGGVNVQYLYADGELYNFINQGTCGQVALNQDIIDDVLKFIKENEVRKACSYSGNVFSVEPPPFVELRITETESGFKGGTVAGVNKPAIVETGAAVYVLLFVEIDDKIKIDTRTDEYLS